MIAAGDGDAADDDDDDDYEDAVMLRMMVTMIVITMETNEVLQIFADFLAGALLHSRFSGRAR